MWLPPPDHTPALPNLRESVTVWAPELRVGEVRGKGVKLIGDDAPKVLNRLAREQMKMKLLDDVLVDLMICDLEGWDQREYIEELHELIDGIGRDKK